MFQIRLAHRLTEQSKPHSRRVVRLVQMCVVYIWDWGKESGWHNLRHWHDYQVWQFHLNAHWWRDGRWLPLFVSNCIDEDFKFVSQCCGDTWPTVVVNRCNIYEWMYQNLTKCYLPYIVNVSASLHHWAFIEFFYRSVVDIYAKQDGSRVERHIL